jgi:hypothetical protein
MATKTLWSQFDADGEFDRVQRHLWISPISACFR